MHLLSFIYWDFCEIFFILPVALSCGECKAWGTAAEIVECPESANPTDPGLLISRGGDITGASSPSWPSPGFSSPPVTDLY